MTASHFFSVALEIKACMTRQEGIQATFIMGTFNVSHDNMWRWRRAVADLARDACRNTSAMLRVDEEEGSRAWVP